MRQFNKALNSFDVSVFNGCYVTGDITSGYLLDLENSRNDAQKIKKGSVDYVDTDVIGLHNSLNKP